MRKHNEHGNALFLIFIAVALFAALSYAVTQSGRGGGNVDRETLALNASDLVQYAALMRSTVDRIRLVNGCSDTEISFEREPFDGSAPRDVNPNAPSDLSCHIFHPNGGGLVFRNPMNLQGALPIQTPMHISDIYFEATNRISGVGSTDSTDDSIDLLLMYSFLTEEACNEINRGLGIGNQIQDSDIRVLDLGSMGFLGVYPLFGPSLSIGDEANGNDLIGQTAACVDETASGSAGFHFYQVLIER